MTRAGCPRQFEVDAARDGRLAGAELASFERHLASCRDCARQAKTLDGWADALRASPEAPMDELHVRRERTRLLAAFDRELVEPAPRRLVRPWWFLLAAAAAVAIVVAGVVLRRSVSSSPRALASNVVVHPDSTAEWSRSADGDRERVVLVRGTIWIQVDHRAPDRRLVVVLPDGELEDLGTTFTVTAEAGRTTRVTVQDGNVVLRLRGRSPHAIAPGESWSAEPPAAPSACAPSAVPVAPSAPDPSTALVAPSPSTAPALPSRPAPRASADAVAIQQDPSADFRAATSALDAGEPARAATLFAAFLARHPHDPRREDAAYLRVIALQRSGDTARTKRAALEYLRNHPTGFRRSEIEPLSR